MLHYFFDVLKIRVIEFLKQGYFQRKVAEMLQSASSSVSYVNTIF